ncbi:MAG TPA: CHASE3 domain-containing protein [Terriglobales bacterium]|nr:CHASE3 domain-containing protein [Terriglobales bacterium]
MSPRKKAHVAFVAAVMLLFLAGLAGYLTIARFLESEKWVIHTHEVRDALAEVDWAMLKAARARGGYAISGSDDLLAQFEATLPEISGKLRHLRDLTQDNPKQQELCSRLEDITARRVALLRESMEMKNETPGSEQRLQAEFARENLPLANEMSSVIQQMREEEERLLGMRKAATHRLFVLSVITLSVAFVLAFILFSVQYRFLSSELTAREQAERVARESEDSLRRLTGRLLKLQDAERRKFSRELHDSLGQFLAGVKMTLEMFITRREETLLAEASGLLNQAIAETRTISHLLHPPLLDEAGFSSAAKWYVEGFSQRSGIEIKVDLPEDAGRLPKPVALGLFRVLQESLTNIHRHSGSAKAEVSLTVWPSQVILKVRDYGKGIAPELLKSFRTKGTKSGVGLAGMRERMRELGGQLNIESCAPGTLIFVTMPISDSTTLDATAAD